MLFSLNPAISTRDQRSIALFFFFLSWTDPKINGNSTITMEFLAITDENRPKNLTGCGPEHPVNVVHRDWMNLKDKSPESVKEFDEKHGRILLKFVTDHMEFVPVCMDMHKPKKQTTCSCLPDLVVQLSDSEVKSCAYSLLTFGKQEKEQQQIRVMDWIAHDQALEKGLMGVGRFIQQKRCVLPGTCNELICKHRLSALIGYGKKKWLACAKLLKENKTPLHGLVGKESNNNQLNRGYKGILEMYFQEILTLAVPRATRIVRNAVRQTETVGATTNAFQFRVELRDDDEELLELPSSMSKRGLYARFLKDWVGIIQVLDAKRRVAAVRPAEDDGEQDMPEIYPSWRTFNRHWQKYHPKLVVAKPREDVCDDCWTYANSFRFKKRSEEDDGTEQPQEQAEVEQANNEAVIEAAALHVKQAQIQRELFNARRKKQRHHGSKLGRNALSLGWSTTHKICLFRNSAVNNQARHTTCVL